MSFSIVKSAQAPTLEANIIDVEVDISRGLQSFSIIGLPEKSVEEAQGRISAAVKNSGFTSPKQKNQKITVSLAPANLKKEGVVFDLAIALGYLKAAKDISFKRDNSLFVGELSLNGYIRPVKGVLPLVNEAKKKGFGEIFVPKDNAKEASLIKGIDIYGVNTLKDIINHINTKKDDVERKKIYPEPETEIEYEDPETIVDLKYIKGQESSKRALEIAAAGGHNIAFFGPPGTGKTLLSKTLSSILPPLLEDDIFESTSLHSIAGALGNKPLITHPPFRSPHHSASPASIMGGGVNPKPGEITLAHNGILFLDEFPEFDRRIIEALRQPLEDKIISIARSKESVDFPANIILAIAMNPCPCGKYGSEKQICTCSAHEINRYQKKLSGPIIDRIDIWTVVSEVDHKKISSDDESEESSKVRERVKKAREVQKDRFGGNKMAINNDMDIKTINKYSKLSNTAKEILIMSSEKMNLSARVYHKIIKIARTIADLEGEEEIKDIHILEALQYRPKDILVNF